MFARSRRLISRDFFQGLVLMESLEPRLLMDSAGGTVAPTFLPGPDVMINANAGARTVYYWAKGISAPDTSIEVGPEFFAMGVDQPQLSALVYDSGGLITDSSGTPMYCDPYIDTGSSGFVVSHMTAQGFTITDIFGDTTFYPGMDIGTLHGSVIGTYTDYGIGGPETGDVISPLGLEIRNGVPLEATIDPDTGDVIPPTIIPSEFTDYGNFSLWVRQQEGYGERQQVMGIDIDVAPMDVFGMPVIDSKVMVMDPTTISYDDATMTFTRMDTQLLPKGSAIPATNMTFRLRMQDFVGATPAPGETFASHTSNPVFDSVTVTGPSATSSGNTFLFDTGSTASMISFAKAKEIGLVDSSVATFDDFMASWTGLTMPIAGVGNITAATTVPILNVPEIDVPLADGRVVQWKNVDVLMADVAGLDGVFGMNLLLPASTIDMGTLTEIGSNPGYFDKIVFDTQAHGVANLSLQFSPDVTAPPMPPAPTLSFTVTNDNHALFAVQPAVGSDGTLTYTVAPNAWGTANVTAVLTENGVVSSAPQTFVIKVNRPGDANGDGFVDQADYAAYFNHYGESTSLANGDLNGDGVVDQADYALYFNNYGAGGSSASAGASTADVILDSAAQSAQQSTQTAPAQQQPTDSLTASSTLPVVPAVAPVISAGASVDVLGRRGDLTSREAQASGAVRLGQSVSQAAQAGHVDDIFDVLGSPLQRPLKGAIR